MENFKTKKDDKLVEVIISPNSDALLDGKSKIRVTIYNESEPKKWRKVTVEEITKNETYKATITKNKLEKRPVIKVKSNFIVDNADNKEQIARNTTVLYNFKGGTSNTQDYESNYTNHQSEYDLGRKKDETFSVTKRVNVILQ